MSGTVKKLLRGALYAELLEAPECVMMSKMVAVKGALLRVQPHPRLTFRADALIAAVRCGEWPIRGSVSCPGCGQPACLGHLFKCSALRKQHGVEDILEENRTGVRALFTREQDKFIKYLHGVGAIGPLESYLLPESQEGPEGS